MDGSLRGGGARFELVMAGLVPATPLNEARLCRMIGVAGTSPAMTANVKTRPNSHGRAPPESPSPAPA